MDTKTCEQVALIAAFRQGLGLSGLAVIRSGDGVRLAAVGQDGLAVVAPGETSEVRFWCRNAADAERIAAAATLKLRWQLSAVERNAPRESSPTPSDPAEVDRPLIAAAARLHVALYANEEISGEAMAAIARVEEELASMQRAGAMKSVNRAYRAYRQDASARGEKIVPYAAWFRKYKQNVVRQLAAALRYF
jgi:hypothetical protein